VAPADVKVDAPNDRVSGDLKLNLLVEVILLHVAAACVALLELGVPPLKLSNARLKVCDLSILRGDDVEESLPARLAHPRFSRHPIRCSTPHGNANDVGESAQPTPMQRPEKSLQSATEGVKWFTVTKANRPRGSVEVLTPGNG
jgi:hypothetical protein